jgi:hypothetical protein
MAAKVFYLVRIEDPSGVSGTGIVAEGVQFSQGDCMVKWASDWPSFNWYPKGWQSTGAVHSHGGKTKIVWADDGPPPEAPGVDINEDVTPPPENGSVEKATSEPANG